MNTSACHSKNNDEDQLIKMVGQIIQNSSLSLYTSLWSKAGFTITRNATLTGYENVAFQFASTPLHEQVSNFQIQANWSEEATAWRLIGSVAPLLINQQYYDYFDKWADAGFYITPVPAPQVKVAGFKPNFFLLGAAKSGTTTLHNYLSEIPSVCMSLPKEPFFFEAEYELGMEHYRRKYFKHWQGESIIGDARHRNLYLPFVARRIFGINPQAKLLVCLRNPIERAYSHWWHWYSRKIENLKFEQAIQEDIKRIEEGWFVETPIEMEVYKEVLDSTGKGIYRSYVDSGYYYQQICRYLEYFPREQIKIILFEDLQQTPYSVVKEIESFLGTDYYRKDNFPFKKENPSLPESESVVRESIPLALRAFLREHYQDHNVNLARLVGKDLSHWD